jgi:hypothetical protein
MIVPSPPFVIPHLVEVHVITWGSNLLFPRFHTVIAICSFMHRTCHAAEICTFVRLISPRSFSFKSVVFSLLTRPCRLASSLIHTYLLKAESLCNNNIILQGLAPFGFSRTTCVSMRYVAVLRLNQKAQQHIAIWVLMAPRARVKQV